MGRLRPLVQLLAATHLREKAPRRVSKHLTQEFVVVGELAGLKLRMQSLVVLENFEATIPVRYQFQGLNPLFSLVQDLFRQTDGTRFIISLGTIFDPEFHRFLLRQGISIYRDSNQSILSVF